jgi:hypothetical protein
MMNEKTYIRTRARTLPIDRCLANENWQEAGMAHILIIRKHTNGNYTIGFYLVDTLALGVKDSFYQFNISKEKLDEIIGHIENSADDFTEKEYVLVHNIIYGAVAFAEEWNYKPCKEFQITRFILEQDTEDIELIELEFGKNGEPLIILNPDL